MDTTKKNSNSGKYSYDSTQVSSDMAAFWTLTESAEFREIMMMYRCAIREVQTKFEVLDDELSHRRNRKPIEYIISRIKRPESIVEKLQRKGYPLTIESIVQNLNDVAGIRIVCSFIDDIYDIAKMLVKQDDVSLIEVKDYIRNPKPNGYRSHHMIIEIPIFLSDRKQPMRVEVQLRTIAMDFWSSLEHQLKYKKDVPHAQDIVSELKECADVIAKTDAKMQEIKNRIYLDEMRIEDIWSSQEETS
ncbi:GTP pyrophosphokinase YwaC [Clostridiales bacterium CHKCI001]|nr:GTP pyrophosphokinase YwaC [Clostridiales bacterium CHKCI001]